MNNGDKPRMQEFMIASYAHLSRPASYWVLAALIATVMSPIAHLAFKVVAGK